MIKVPKFVKEHLPLCVGSLVFLGYLGYHAVRWSKGQRAEKVEQIAHKSNSAMSQSNNSSNPLVNRANNLENSQDKITMGQGEYIVFHKSTTGEKQPVSREIFEQVYQVLLRHSPTALANSGSAKATEDCTNRYELIKAKLKEIDPTLEVIFVPRTLYELVFIRKCIQEDLKRKEVCSDVDTSAHKISLRSFKGDETKYQTFLKEQQEERAKRKCWHVCYFSHAGDNEHTGVKDVAYRLNKTMLKAFDPLSEGFTHQELSAFAEKEIEFLKVHHKNGLEAAEKRRRGEKVEEIASCNSPGPTTNFGFESTRGSIKPMGIRNETDAQIIRDAIALECSKTAQYSLFLYRGANFEKDSTSCWDDRDTPYSLSYGSSLFAGCVFDGGATAFHYMRNGQNAYAIPVAFDQLKESPFFAPTTHTVAQLFGNGEIFHARTKAWKDFDLKKIGGVNMGINGHKRDHLTSDLSQEELNSQFIAYKNKAVLLK